MYGCRGVCELVRARARTWHRIAALVNRTGRHKTLTNFFGRRACQCNFCQLTKACVGQSATFVHYTVALCHDPIQISSRCNFACLYKCCKLTNTQRQLVCDRFAVYCITSLSTDVLYPLIRERKGVTCGTCE